MHDFEKITNVTPLQNTKTVYQGIDRNKKD